jgi:tripartite ATP-independent transporter DctM subunit
MSIELITLLLFGSLVALLITGLPLAFILPAIAMAFGVALWGMRSAPMYFQQTWYSMNMFVLVAIPMFIFMGLMLERSGIADDLFEMIYRWAGGIRGGLAMGTVVICAMFAAMVGISGAATVSMGFIALPAMLKRNYDKRLCVGTIMSGGALGFLIPPSVPMVVYGFVAGQSVGKLFAGGIFPGLILSLIYIIYIGIRGLLQPNLCPVIPPQERANLKEKLISLRAVTLPLLLIFAVLGTIFLGMTTPSEASAIGAIGSIICAAVHRRLNWSILKEALYRTMRLSAMVFWIVFGALAFSAVYAGLGSKHLVETTVLALPIGPWGILIMIQLSFFVLGCFMDDTAILFMTMPVYVPIIQTVGFDPLWFGILYILNMEMAYLTPPFGYCLFYMKGVVGELFRTKTIAEEIKIGDIYRSVGPFVALQGLGLVLVMIFPQLALWLPSVLFKR